MIMWGLVTQFFATNSSWVAQAAGVLIAAVLLWDVLFRAQLGVSVVFMEEMFARNLGQLFASPLRPYELVLALISISLVRTCIGVGTAALKRSRSINTPFSRWVCRSSRFSLTC